MAQCFSFLHSLSLADDLPLLGAFVLEFGMLEPRDMGPFFQMKEQNMSQVAQAKCFRLSLGTQVVIGV